jgi:TonB family protein
MRLFVVRVFVALIAFASNPAVASAAPAGCDINITNVRAIGSDPKTLTFVYGVDISRADGKPLDAKLTALAPDGTTRQEFEVRGALPVRGLGKNEWSGLAFSLGANTITTILFIADSEPGTDETPACPARTIDLKKAQTWQRRPWPIKATDPGMIDFPTSMIPAAGAIVPLDIQDARCAICKPPDYPQAAMMDNIDGRIVIGVTVGADGVARDFAVLTSWGRDLDAASMSAARASTFSPATVNGTAVDSHIAVEFEFRLDH